MRKLATIAVLALQLVSWGAHFGLVEHDLCATHGELVHAGDGHDHGPTGPGYATTTDVEHEHDVCAVWGSVEHAGDTSPVCLDAPPPSPYAAFTADRTAVPVDRLRLAPKTSPPA